MVGAILTASEEEETAAYWERTPFEAKAVMAFDKRH